ncbi:hypothetical protein [Sphingobium sp.]|uniref:hypothetical protein n=1 Tax=Sphingobium sp. TaxID=1912891 RepID=UPI002BDC2B53|nr:hypothetical protein [Sphingobium sp.]HUD94493.1 hypothetical protein [Sphingobium sp.]
MRCLILYYSMTGQAERAATLATQTAEATGWEVSLCRIAMREPADHLARPMNVAASKKWTQGAQKGMTVPIMFDPANAVGRRYDAVLLFSNTWGDHPSVPVRSFLESEEARALLADTPVGLYIVCRRLWEKNLGIARELVERAGGHVLGGEAFMHPGGQVGSLIQTITYLYRTDNGRTHFLGFPLPRYGLSDVAMARIPTYTAELLASAIDRKGKS